MTAVKELLKYFIPSGLQVFYSFVAALLIAFYWSKEQLGEKLTPPGSEESVQTFQELIKRFVDYWTNNDFIGFLSVALIWAVAGIFILAFVYETVNIFIELRNDRLITTRFTHAEENKKILLHTFVVRIILIAAFIVFLSVAVALLFPFWQDLINQPASQFFEAKSIFNEILGILGLGATICLIWRWVLILFSKLD